MVEKVRTDPSVGRSRVREAAPAAILPPTEAKEGCSGLVGEACAHRSSTASSTADDHLTLDGDANVCRERCPEHAGMYTFYAFGSARIFH